MNWRHIYDGQGWKAQVAKHYGIGTIPFTLLIGTRTAGLLRSTPVEKKLEPAIRAALDK
ncbi:hypothetical protein J8C02_04785 [Chloracidobacterium sp. MS 40/45]|uniref:hypothetical protein n=1 Tax=Chloracidobacterium aggregatum TaxID=2851959 RepID=UPI001B8D800F|nr:hypothetical protein [Chloracidobacterium aggregatum]QUW00814.1 hypothetical protein J8C02_04785 [Chloracidobacterium sp. MS 40/45]